MKPKAAARTARNKRRPTFSARCQAVERHAPDRATRKRASGPAPGRASNAVARRIQARRLNGFCALPFRPKAKRASFEARFFIFLCDGGGGPGTVLSADEPGKVPEPVKVSPRRMQSRPPQEERQGRTRLPGKRAGRLWPAPTQANPRRGSINTRPSRLLPPTPTAPFKRRVNAIQPHGRPHAHRPSPDGDEANNPPEYGNTAAGNRIGGQTRRANSKQWSSKPTLDLEELDRFHSIAGFHLRRFKSRSRND